MPKDFPDVTRFGELSVAEVVIELENRLAEVLVMESDPMRTDTERAALRSAISQLKELIRKNVC